MFKLLLMYFPRQSEEFDRFPCMFVLNWTNTSYM